jgi:hypothetical protein
MPFSAEELKPLYENQLSPIVFASINQIMVTADQAVLRLAQEAIENKVQNEYYEAAQSLRIARNHISKCFDANLFQKSFPEHIAVDSEHIKSLESLSGLQADSWKANASLAAAILDLEKRLQELGPDVLNPLNPEHFSNSFIHALAEAEIDIHTKNLVLRTFESHLYTRLEKYTRQINDVLAESGVLPELHTAPSDVTLTMNAIVEGGESGESIHAAAELLDHALADLQASQYEGLEDRLRSSEALSWVDVPARDLIKEMQKEMLIPETLDSNAQLESEKIALVRNLFDFILQDRSIPLVARAVLSEMQVTYSRIALQQSDFLQDNQHPAKKLLSEITVLASHWECNKEDLDDDEFFGMLVQSVIKFVEAERIEQLNIKEMIFDFLVYAEAQRQRDVLSTQRLIDGEMSAAGAESARKEVEDLIAEKVSDKELPGATLRFLNEGWSNVLYLCAVKAGKSSQVWQQAVNVVDEMVLTTHNAEPFETRTDLLVRLPVLLKTIREGLSSIDMSPVLMNQMFSDLEGEHKRIIAEIDNPEINEESLNDCREKAKATVIDFAQKRDEKSEEEALADQEASISDESTVATDVQDLPDDEVAAVVSEGSENNEAVEKLATLGQGSSLLWNKDGEKVRCRIAAYIKHAQKYILTDRSGAKIADFVEADMLEKLGSGELETIDSEPMFERALESVIGGMRSR